MKYKYVVFDWDGTLADTYPVISAAYDYTFDKMGLLRIPYDEVKRITSTLQNKDTLGYVFKNRRDEAAMYFYEYVEKYHTERLRPMPGAKEILEFCRKNDAQCYLITNKKTKFIRAELEKLGFAPYFKKIVAAGEYSEDKPHPIACMAVFDGNLPPVMQIAVIGDGEADVRTAAVYEHNGDRAVCILVDPTGKYDGTAADCKVTDLWQAAEFLEKEDNAK